VIQTYVQDLRNPETELKNKSSGLVERVVKFLKVNAITNANTYISDILGRVKELVPDKSTSSKIIQTDNIVGLIKWMSEGDPDYATLVNLLMEFL
jgi:hypothetical protein